MLNIQKHGRSNKETPQKTSKKKWGRERERKEEKKPRILLFLFLSYSTVIGNIIFGEPL